MNRDELMKACDDLSINDLVDALLAEGEADLAAGVANFEKVSDAIHASEDWDDEERETLIATVMAILS